MPAAAAEPGEKTAVEMAPGSLRRQMFQRYPDPPELLQDRIAATMMLRFATSEHPNLRYAMNRNSP